MSTDLHQANLARLISEAQALSTEAKRSFGSFTPLQLNWKPNADEWSIGQCFDHMITATSAYFPILAQIQAGTKRPTLWERLPLLPSIFGTLLIRSLSPDAAYNTQAPAVFRPTQSSLDGQIITQFVEIQQQLLAFMKATTAHDAQRIVLTSPVSRFITYRLLDAYRVIIVHDNLHFRQAQRILAWNEFPDTKQPGG